jgi:NADH oxidase (H2O2-forming)
MKVSIVGGGSGGASAAGTIRYLDKEAEIDIFTKRDDIGWGPCEMPFVLAGTIKSWDDIYAFTKPQFEKRNIKVHLNSEVSDIIRKEKRIVTGGENYEYDKLILSLGSVPDIPSILGLDGNNEFVLSTDIASAKALEKVINQYQSVAVVGASSLALEMVSIAKAKGYSNIYLLGRSGIFLRNSLDEDMSEIVKEILRETGIELILPAKINSIKSKNGKKSLMLPDRELEVDFVFFGTSSTPNVEVARRAGLEIGKTGAIVVNQYLQTSDPDIYAVGDCMENWDSITGSKRRAQLASNTERTSNIAARNLVQNNIISYEGTIMGFMVELFGYQIGSAGFTEAAAREQGLDIVSEKVNTLTRWKQFSGKPITYKLIADRNRQTLVGAQIISKEMVAGKIDKLALAIREKIPLPKLYQIDIGFSPIVGIDPLMRIMERLMAKF